MKENIKESLQFILQHNAIGSPLVQHAQNLARHVTSQHYEAMTANEEYPSGSDNGLQWARDLVASPQVTDEQIISLREQLGDEFASIEFASNTGILAFSRALLALSVPPAAAETPTAFQAHLDRSSEIVKGWPTWKKAALTDNSTPLVYSNGVAAAPQEVRPVVTDDILSFRKKPVVIKAVQWTGKNLYDVIAFTDGVPDIKGNHAGMKWDEYRDLVNRDGLKIYTLEGNMNADVGDWIIKGVKGEHYPCKPDVFELTYERAVAPQEKGPADKDVIMREICPECGHQFKCFHNGYINKLRGNHG